jgi:acetyl-CoA carboxylase carboxyl transferase subunit beta
LAVPEWLRIRRSPQQSAGEAAQWTKCPRCSTMLYRPDLAKNLYVCTTCSHHFRMHAFDRVAMLVDGDFTEIGNEVQPGDPLGWTDKVPYPQKLAKDREKSKLSEGVVCGFAAIGEFEVALGVMDFNFGARMEEGMLALMQMAKTTLALERFRADGGYAITVLTDPTTGGVSASFAFQSDIVMAESKAAIGFAGRRVIEQTIRQKLPDNFQTAEFLLEHGAIDAVVDRHALRDTLVRFLDYGVGAPKPPPVAERNGRLSEATA